MRCSFGFSQSQKCKCSCGRCPSIGYVSIEEAGDEESWDDYYVLVSQTLGSFLHDSNFLGILPDDYYQAKENWQKAIGGHSLWGEAQVYNCKDKFSMQITIHAIDRYNFNKGASDIATGAPDNENGRFEVLGWAKSFTTHGSIPIAVDWKRGSVGEMEVGSNGRWSVVRSRARGR